MSTYISKSDAQTIVSMYNFHYKKTPTGRNSKISHVKDGIFILESMTGRDFFHCCRVKDVLETGPGGDGLARWCHMNLNDLFKTKECIGCHRKIDDKLIFQLFLMYGVKI